MAIKTERICFQRLHVRIANNKLLVKKYYKQDTYSDLYFSAHDWSWR